MERTTRGGGDTEMAVMTNDAKSLGLGAAS
jgi:hypothetical protein